MIIEKASSKRIHFTLREAVMADRKGRTVTFKLPRKLNAGLIKTAIEKDLSSKVTVFQDLGSGESLV